jgi:hypothetical protein
MTTREQELCRKARNKAFQDAIDHVQAHVDSGLSKEYPGDFVAKQIVEGLRALMEYPTDDILLEDPRLESPELKALRERGWKRINKPRRLTDPKE